MLWSSQRVPLLRENAECRWFYSCQWGLSIIGTCRARVLNDSAVSSSCGRIATGGSPTKLLRKIITSPTALNFKLLHLKFSVKILLELTAESGRIYSTGYKTQISFFKCNVRRGGKNMIAPCTDRHNFFWELSAFPHLRA